jgi:hypothetical protein
VLHLLAVFLYPGLMERVPQVRVSPTQTPPEIFDVGLQVVALREVDEVPERPDEQRLEPVLDLTDPSPPDAATVPSELRILNPGGAAPPPPPSGVAREEERERTVAERLRPQMVDPRVWAPLERSILDLSDAELAEIYLRGMIRSWSDSVAVAAALSGDVTDWTFTDDDGRRWGLAPGRLHLGDFSIPLPISFEIPAGRRDEMARRQWEQQDVVRGTASAELRRSWAERAQEIRVRMELDRARASGQQGGGGGASGGGGTGGSGGGGGSGGSGGGGGGG